MAAEMRLGIAANQFSPIGMALSGGEPFLLAPRAIVTFPKTSLMFWRVFYIPCLLVIVAAVVARVWFGKKVQLGKAEQACRFDAGRWADVVGGSLTEAEAKAGELGRLLWKSALLEWKKRDPKSARARDAAKRFGMAVPPLTIAIVLFALIAARIPVSGAISIFLAATAISSVLGLLSIGAELRAVAVSVRKLRENRVFPRRDDEDSVISCAVAEVWLEALPPILRWI